MMRITKEQVRDEKFRRTHTVILKAHLWFGSDVLSKVLKDYPYTYEDTMLEIWVKKKGGIYGKG